LITHEILPSFSQLMATMQQAMTKPGMMAKLQQAMANPALFATDPGGLFIGRS
jgi:hypothetical protein